MGTLGVWFGPDLQLGKNSAEVQSNVGKMVEEWLCRRLSMNGRAEVSATYTYSLILYSVLVLPIIAKI